MKFADFKAQFRGLPLIPIKIVFGKASRADINQVERWRKRGLLIRLRRGLYLLGKAEREIEPSRLYLAGQYSPEKRYWASESSFEILYRDSWSQFA